MEYGAGSYHRRATRSASYKLGKRGTAGKPAPSWLPNLRRDGTYDSRPSKSARQQYPDTFAQMKPENGSRIFISGLPRDTLSQDLEDLMTSTVGPIHEAYIVYQYGGTPLYKTSVDGSKPRRDPDAEKAENIRNVVSTGCGMVHFQKVKDAMEAWEKYHGKFVDGKSTALRVQIVVDADESWITDRPINEVPLMGDSDEETLANPTIPPNIMSSLNRSGNAATSKMRNGQDSSANVSEAPGKDMKRESGGSTKASFQQRPLLSRIGALSDTHVPRSGTLCFGTHTITANPKSLSERIETPQMSLEKKGPNLPPIIPRGRIKRGPRRLAKYEARKQQMQSIGTNLHPPMDNAPRKVPARSVEGPWQNRGTTASYLDAEMDQYRQQGLMGLMNKS
ncbi:hypothetical protein CPB86DRAFT_777358 [Serendipita vermifera]|nr:hypothetical protein CPB86DRAFT_777358 [Serendipita vermifera]